jgi:tRNA (cmo5U34)-methyltransferase
MRELDFGNKRFDVIVTAAALHHLRTDVEWEQVFAKFYAALRPGGSVWISDLVIHDQAAVHELMWNCYGDYLTQLKDEKYRDHVFAYIEQEDTPRSVMFQIDLLRKVGFGDVEILHKNSCFAAFGGVKR